MKKIPMSNLIKLYRYNYSLFSFVKLNPSQPRLFRVKWAGDKICFLIRIDILNRAYILIRRKPKGFTEHIDDLSYGYL